MDLPALLRPPTRFKKKHFEGVPSVAGHEDGLGFKINMLTAWLQSFESHWQQKILSEGETPRDLKTISRHIQANPSQA